MAVFDDPLIMDRVAGLICTSTLEQGLADLHSLRQVCRDPRVADVLRRHIANLLVERVVSKELDLKLLELDALFRFRARHAADVARLLCLTDAFRAQIRILRHDRLANTGQRDRVARSLVNVMLVVPECAEEISAVLREMMG